jgi:hypothetical protein
MITLDWFGLSAICFLCVLLGVIIGHKTSAHRWIEYEEWKAWKAQKK